MLDALAHYEILGRIGGGRLGELLRARDTRVGRTVALRVVSQAIAGDPEGRARLLQDARAASSLSHPNIAALYESGDDQERLFLASEFVPGETLRSLVAGGALNPRRALEYAIQLADALAEVHAQGIVHGDVRPAHIIVTPRGMAKFVDVGFAAWSSGDERRRSVRGGTAEDVAYRSPEQLRETSVDHRTDVYALGVVLIEMLAGARPWAAQSAIGIIDEVLRPPPAARGAASPALSPDLDAVVSKMLEKAPGKRYESAAVVAAELRSIAAGLDARASVASPLPSAVPARRGARARAILIVLVTIGTIGALAFFLR